MRYCVICGQILIGRQRKHCSHVCEVKDWQSRNKDRVHQYKRNYVLHNPEKRKQSVKNYDSSHKERRVAWLERNAEQVREYFRRRAQTPSFKEDNKIRTHRRRALIRSLTRHFTKTEWEELKHTYGHGCLACGRKDKLSADHVKPLCLGGTNEISNIQPLCLRCNFKKNAKEIDYRPLHKLISTGNVSRITTMGPRGRTL